MKGSLTRRDLLTRSLVIGCSAAASPLVTPVTLAAAPWDTRLVVIILRGGMDGLGVVQPHGDKRFKTLRPNLYKADAQKVHDLDGFFALHPALGGLMPLWKAGELGFAHAVSTPYRDKRSHFDGQDLLEAGTGFDVGPQNIRDGWLNRMLQAVPGVQAETAYAIGQGEMRVLSGPAPSMNWSPEVGLQLDPATQSLLSLVSETDPLVHAAISDAFEITSATDRKTTGKSHIKIAEFAADQLVADTRIATFSLNGWDTHRAQQHSLNAPLGRLQDTLLTLKKRMGPVWGKTAVLAMTEFGRTVRENGSKGTDHGTGGAMLFAGGAIRGGRVYGDWPGLGQNDLYQQRDLMPLADVRSFAGGAMRGLFGLGQSQIEQVIFPGLDMSDAPEILL